MNDAYPEPESRHASGIPEPGGVPPGETPPAEDGLSGSGPQETYNPTTGWAAGPLIALMIVVLLFSVFFLVGYLTR
jgi:hypothetical protein